MPDLVLLDTDTLSEIMRGRDANIVQKAGDYLKAQGQFRISIITRYVKNKDFTPGNAPLALSVSHLTSYF